MSDVIEQRCFARGVGSVDADAEGQEGLEVRVWARSICAAVGDEGLCKVVQGRVAICEVWR
jgi:hypothetical protein